MAGNLVGVVTARPPNSHDPVPGRTAGRTWVPELPGNDLRGPACSPNVVPVRKWRAGWRLGVRWTPGGIAVGELAPAAARDAGRGRLLALGAGLLAGSALAVTARSRARSRAAKLAGRYALALEQLGCDELDVRIGGIRALERVARDSSRYHPAVVQMLAAFVRERSRRPWPPPDSGGPARPRSPRPDVQAAITVVGRLLAERDLEPVDLTGADLAGADLTGAVLTGAVLARADLLAATLVHADLSGAELGGARLTGANLTGADFTGADLADADLADSDLADAEFARADLTGALWPADGPLPAGWQRHAGSGQLIAASIGADRAQAHQPHR
jgi:hypothetical protein